KFRRAHAVFLRQHGEFTPIRDHARELLEDPRYLVKDVAAFTGWRSPFYFSNSYRKAFGIPPQKQLRDRQKNSR
ncbi:MAG: hypothetical protein IKO93_21055, partial [Lentisphaeria bacterium]|nr:hypothetical protein [Lentisphaeria bacterium]